LAQNQDNVSEWDDNLTEVCSFSKIAL
jgi:hypothetical protein